MFRKKIDEKGKREQRSDEYEENKLEDKRSPVQNSSIVLEKEKRVRLRKPKWVTRSMAEELSREDILRATCFEFLVYLAFVICVCISVMGSRSSYNYYLTKSLSVQFVEKDFNTINGVSITFSQICSATDLWMYLENHFVPSIFWEYTYDSEDREEYESEMNIMYENRILGVPRIRQVKVRNDSCEVHDYFRRYFISCFDTYQPGDKDEDDFGSGQPTARRTLWTEADLRSALLAISNGTSIKSSAKWYEIPRTTLGLHYRKQNFKRELGRSSVLSSEQENDLVTRIHRLSEVGMPITSKVLMKSVYTYVCENNIPNPFSKQSKCAGRKWLKLFLTRHPEVARRRAQQMNPVRVQKVNKHIVEDYFRKLKEVMENMELFDKPGNILYNMDEKGCRLTIHNQQIVLAKRGSKRVHLTAPEHGENVTIVGCGNPLGQYMPPFILFKGQRLKPEWSDHLPSGSKAIVTKKGSMTCEAFVLWLHHFASFKHPGPALLIFDGAKCHLDISIVEAADSLDITLFGLPSNTSHELQPMDKSVFRSFETFWDQEVLHFLTTNPGKALTKMRFGEIFNTVWLKAMTPSNIISGFRATGIYPFRPHEILESAFAPSATSHRENDKENHEINFQNVVDEPEGCASAVSINDAPKASTSQKGCVSAAHAPKASTSGYKVPRSKRIKTAYRETYSSDSESLSDFSLHDDTSDNISSEDDFLDTVKDKNTDTRLDDHQKNNLSTARTLPSNISFNSDDDDVETISRAHPDFENINVKTLKEHQKKKSFNAKNKLPSSSFDSDDEMPLITLKIRENIASGSSPRDSRRLNNSFTTSGLLITPEMKILITKRKPALNSKAQTVTKDLWTYSSAKETKSLQYWGQVSTYGGDGFYVDLLRDRNGTMKIIQDLKENMWIQRGTRAMFIDFTVYNANMNLFAVCKFVFELPPVGGLLTKAEIHSMKLLRFLKKWDYIVLGCELASYIFILYYLSEEIREMLHFKLNYMLKFWNYVDLTIIACAIAGGAMSLLEYIEVPLAIEALNENPDQYANIEYLASMYTSKSNLFAIMLFLVIMKAFKYLNFNRTMGQLNSTLKQCSKDVVGFSLMFFIVFFAFSELGYLLFGSAVENFSSFGLAMFTLLRTILGDFNYDELERADRVLAPIYFLSYIFLVFFVLMNMFLAIINDTYNDVKTEIAITPDELQMTEFLRDNFYKLLRKIGVKKNIDTAVAKSEINATIRQIREVLLKCGFNFLEIEMFFARYGVNPMADVKVNDVEGLIRDLEIGVGEQQKKLEQLDKTLGELVEQVKLLLERLDRMETVKKVRRA
nr:unnamed protein product [Callosobruchus chinensis]